MERQKKRKYKKEDIKVPEVGGLKEQIHVEEEDKSKPIKTRESDKSSKVAKKRSSWLSRGKNIKSIGIDLGTANTIFYSDEGIILREPSVVAFHKNTGEILAAGSEAKKMIGRTPGNIVAINPLKSGVIADFDVTCKMIEFFLRKCCGKRRLSRYVVRVCAPYGITDVEKRAISESIQRLGVKSVGLIEEPLAAAIGAELNVSEPIGSMVVDIGGGTTETAVISLGGIVTGVSTRIGGDTLDESIVAYIKKNYNLLIAEKTAERLKIKIGTVDENRIDEAEVKGRDLITGLPASKMVSSSDILEAIKVNVYEMIQDIKVTLEKSPPELASDIVCNGIVLTGGGALLDGLDKLIEKETLVPVKVAENPLDCVARGTGMSLEVLRY